MADPRPLVLSALASFRSSPLEIPRPAIRPELGSPGQIGRQRCSTVPSVYPWDSASPTAQVRLSYGPPCIPDLF